MPAGIVSPTRHERVTGKAADGNSQACIAFEQAPHQAEVRAANRSRRGFGQLRISVALSNPRRDTCHGGEHQYKAAVVVNMRMNAVVGSVLAQSPPKIERVPRRISVVQAGDDAGAERAYFFVVSTRTRVT